MACPMGTSSTVRSHPTNSFHCALHRNVRVTALPLKACTCVDQEFILAAESWALLAIMQRKRYSVIGRSKRECPALVRRADPTSLHSTTNKCYECTSRNRSPVCHNLWRTPG